MASSIYYVNPAADFPTYFNCENYAARGLRPATQMADLAIPTLAAMTPPDFTVALVDQNISRVDLDTPAEVVGITGKITQRQHMIDLAAEYRKRGKLVVIGGPYASLSPEVLRPHCDVLVRGEIEEIAPQIFADLRAGTWKEEYQGTQPSLATSPTPRWDLYPNDRSVMGTLQTSRGCPFECEFCDVIQYAGRKQRHKNPDQVIRELDVLYRHGHRSVFLADDNFTVYRARAKELLLALRRWNQAQSGGKVSFLTQVSIDAAKDDEMLTLCAEAGLTTVFIGLETPNENSLRETKKRQNLRLNLVDEVQNFLAHGIHVVGGMIVGFDADGPDIFERQFDFAMATGIPIFSVGALVAPAATPLHDRIRRAGRLKENGSEVAAVPWTTNIVHPRMSEAQLLGGLRWLANNLYHPKAFAERMLVFIDKFGKRRDPKVGEPMKPGNLRSVDADSLQILNQVRRLGADEASMWTRVVAAAAKKPETMAFMWVDFIQYMQIRHMFELGQFWEPRLGETASPAEALTTLSPPRRGGPTTVSA